MPEKDRWFGVLITSALLLVLLIFALFKLFARLTTFLMHRLINLRVPPRSRGALPNA
jgi:hypothetical protein